MHPGHKGGGTRHTCAICLENYVEGDKLRVLPCQHRWAGVWVEWGLMGGRPRVLRFAQPAQAGRPSRQHHGSWRMLVCSGGGARQSGFTGQCIANMLCAPWPAPPHHRRYHAECIDQWLSSRKPLCPACRHDATERDVEAGSPAGDGTRASPARRVWAALGGR